MDKQSYTFNWASGSETQFIAAKIYYTVCKVVYDSDLLQLRSKKSTAVVAFFFLILVLFLTAQVTEFEGMTTSPNLGSGQC